MLGPDIPEFRPGGPPPTLGQLRQIVDAIRGGFDVNVLPPLYKAGNSLRLAQRQSIWAEVTGSASPYGLNEKWDDGTGAGWVTKPGGVVCTACAYEANAKAGLGGLVYRIRKGKATNEWRFLDDRYKSPCDSTFQPCLVGCTLGTSYTYVAGCTLTLRDSLGNVVLDSHGNSSCTSGCCAGSDCSWSVTPGASYTLSIAPPAGKLYYLSATYSFTATCGINSPLISVPIDTASYVCCPPCPSDCGFATSGVPIPKTLTLDYGVGSTTLTYTSSVTLAGTTYNNVWYGTARITPICNSHHVGTDSYGNPACLDDGIVAVDIDFIFWCDNIRGPRLIFWIPGVCCAGDYFDCLAGTVSPAFSVLGPFGEFDGFAQAGYTCDPPYFTFSVPGSGDTATCDYVEPGVGICETSGPLDVMTCIFQADPGLFTVHA